jgi:hypothetical protein
VAAHGERHLGRRERDRGRGEPSFREVHVAVAHPRRRRVDRGHVAAAAVGVLEADAEEGRVAGHRVHEAHVHTRRLHLRAETPARLVLPDLADGEDVEEPALAPRAEEHGRVVGDDVELAVVPHVEEPFRAALVPPEVVVSLEGEEDSGPDAPDADEAAERRVFSEPQSSSHSGFSLMGWRAVSIVAVTSVSG